MQLWEQHISPAKVHRLPGEPKVFLLLELDLNGCFYPPLCKEQSTLNSKAVSEVQRLLTYMFVDVNLFFFILTCEFACKKLFARKKLKGSEVFGAEHPVRAS